MTSRPETGGDFTQSMNVELLTTRKSADGGVPGGIWIGLSALAVIALAGPGFLLGRRSDTSATPK